MAELELGFSCQKNVGRPRGGERVWWGFFRASGSSLNRRGRRGSGGRGRARGHQRSVDVDASAATEEEPGGRGDKPAALDAQGSTRGYWSVGASASTWRWTVRGGAASCSWRRMVEELGGELGCGGAWAGLESLEPGAGRGRGARPRRGSAGDSEAGARRRGRGHAGHGVPERATGGIGAFPPNQWSKRKTKSTTGFTRS